MYKYSVGWLKDKTIIFPELLPCRKIGVLPHVASVEEVDELSATGAAYVRQTDTTRGPLKHVNGEHGLENGRAGGQGEGVAGLFLTILSKHKDNTARA
jgi:hypothetical protein